MKLYAMIIGGRAAVLGCCVAFSLCGCEQGPRSGGAAATKSPAVASPTAPAAAPSKVFGAFAKTPSVKSPPAKSLARDVRPAVRFADRAQELGIDFTYQNGARGQQLMVESTGGGAGWLDYDRDGWPDLYLGQGGDPWRPAAPDQPRDELYRNRFGERFESVTTSAGIDERGYGQGVCVGDFDNDGFEDLLVTDVGPSHLYHNAGDGTFQDVTESAKLQETHWSTSAAWGDVDLDGDLDLYVCRYCQYDPAHPQPCFNKEGQPSICHPAQVQPEPDEFYVNLGDGTFRAAARELGLYGVQNRGLGVVIADFDNDHWPDIFVANDTTPNYMYISDQGRHFEEQATILGCAVSSEGSPQANMGIAVGDYDRNGYLDLYVTHFSNEWNTLYANDGPAGFADRTGIMRLVPATLPMLGFGTTMHDFNGDGRLELFVANGHINERRTEGTGYAQAPQLFSFNGSSWDDIGRTAGPDFELPIVGRGVAVADYDRDGRIDLVCVPQHSPTKLLHNESEGSRVLQMDCIGRTSSRQAVGARVTVTAAGERQAGEIFGGGSYCSSQERTLTFGFGADVSTVDIELVWPSGITQILRDVATPQRLKLIEPPQESAKRNR